MTKKLEAERLGRWLKDPVTRMYMEDLEALRDDLIHQCGRGDCEANNGRTIEQMYMYFRGAIHTANTVMDARFVMAERFSEEEKDEEK